MSLLAKTACGFHVVREKAWMYGLELQLLALLIIQLMKSALEVVADMAPEPPHNTAWSLNPTDPYHVVSFLLKFAFVLEREVNDTHIPLFPKTELMYEHS